MPDDESKHRAPLENGMENKESDIELEQDISACLPAPEGFDEKVPSYRERMSLAVGNVKKRMKERKKSIIIVLLVILFITFLVLIIAWPRLPHHMTAPRCNSPQCLRVAALYAEAMNETVSPCKDPWTWACGRWQRQASVHRTNWGQRDDLILRELTTRLRDIVTSMEDLEDPESVNWKLKTLYESCMALNNIEADDHGPLLKIIKELGGWSVLRSWDFRRWVPMEVLETLHLKFGASPFFRISVVPDAQDPHSMLLKLAPAGLGLPDPSYYHASSDSAMVKAYKLMMKETVVLMGATTEDAITFADDIFGYEQRLAHVPSNVRPLQASAQKQNVYTLGELLTTTQSLPLQSILGALFPIGRINQSTKIVLPVPSYIQHLAAIISSTEKSILNNYFMWTLVREYLPYMSHKYREILHEFNSKITGSKHQIRRWQFCSSLLYKVFPLAVNALIVNHTDNLTQVHNDVKLKSISEIFTAIQLSTENKIRRAPWINTTLENHLIKKLKSMTVQIGFPKLALNESFIKKYYSKLFVQKRDLFQNIGFSFAFRRHQMENIYTAAFNNNERLFFLMTDLKSVKYVESHNLVMVPELLANPPYYHPNYPLSIKYGRIGVEIGTAVAKAILQQEISYSMEKKPSIILNYSRTVNHSRIAANCLRSVLLFGHGISGNVANITTINTLIHVTGVKLSLGGMEWFIKNVASNLGHEHMPGLDVYEDIAVFALSYAQDQCSIYTREQTLYTNVVNMEVDKKTLFLTVWSQIAVFSEFLGCILKPSCAEIL